MTGVHQCRMPVLATIGGAALRGCADAAAPVAPPDRPALAANAEGPAAVESVIALEPLLTATIPMSMANDINDLGQAVGESAAPGAQRHAVLWDVNTSVFPVDLGTLPAVVAPVPSATAASYTWLSLGTGSVIIGLLEGDRADRTSGQRCRSNHVHH